MKPTLEEIRDRAWNNMLDAHRRLVVELRTNGPGPQAERLLTLSQRADIFATIAVQNYCKARDRAAAKARTAAPMMAVA